jgi:hypothetical protein
MTDNRLPEETSGFTRDGVAYFHCSLCGGHHVVVREDEACGACGLIVYPEDPAHVCDLDPEAQLVADVLDDFKIIGSYDVYPGDVAVIEAMGRIIGQFGDERLATLVAMEMGLMAPESEVPT